MSDHDLQRLVSVSADGLQDIRGTFPDARLDGFVIVAMIVYTDQAGEEREAPVIWAEGRRHYPKVGILKLGLDLMRLGDGEGDELSDAG